MTINWDRFGNAVESTLLKCAPENNPMGWLMLNIICLGSSIILLMLILIGGGRGNFLAEGYYLVYNFATTLIWVVEIGLSVWVMAEGGDIRRAGWGRLIELALAIYFLVDSCRVAYCWNFDLNHTGGMLVDFFINTIAYLYMVITVVRMYQRREEGFESIDRLTENVNDGDVRPNDGN